MVTDWSKRICPKCGKPPVLIDGVGLVDACIGKKIDGVESICCGHGIHTAYIVFDDGTRVPEYHWNRTQEEMQKILNKMDERFKEKSGERS